MKIDKSWPLSASEQLKSQVRHAIRHGRLRPGQSLPRVKALASELGLNANTIAGAYRELAGEGYLTFHRRGGTKVAAGIPFASPIERQLQAMTDRLIRHAREHDRNAADILRLVAARWAATDADPFGEEGRYPVYDLLQRHEHDQG